MLVSAPASVNVRKFVVRATHLEDLVQLGTLTTQCARFLEAAVSSGLARRIAHERDARGWSYDGLAQRMTEAGCSIQASALFKIEKGDPPRRITVDELVALGRVFRVPPADLLIDPVVANHREAVRRFNDYVDAALAEQEAYEQMVVAASALTAFFAEQPEAREALEDAYASVTDEEMASITLSAIESLAAQAADPDPFDPRAPHPRSRLHRAPKRRPKR